jgi:hypothetical protein
MNGDVLVVGQRCRLSPGGPVYVVTRVGQGAAYLRGGNPREVTLIDKKTGEERSFTAAGAESIAVARNAFVYPEEA